MIFLAVLFFLHATHTHLDFWGWVLLAWLFVGSAIEGIVDFLELGKSSEMSGAIGSLHAMRDTLASINSDLEDVTRTLNTVENEIAAIRTNKYVDF